MGGLSSMLYCRLPHSETPIVQITGMRSARMPPDPTAKQSSLGVVVGPVAVADGTDLKRSGAGDGEGVRRGPARPAPGLQFVDAERVTSASEVAQAQMVGRLASVDAVVHVVGVQHAADRSQASPLWRPRAAAALHASKDELAPRLQTAVTTSAVDCGVVGVTALRTWCVEARRLPSWATTVSAATPKLIPSTGRPVRVVVYPNVATPMTAPQLSTIGPPLFPGFTGAST